MGNAALVILRSDYPYFPSKFACSLFEHLNAGCIDTIIVGQQHAIANKVWQIILRRLHPCLVYWASARRLAASPMFTIGGRDVQENSGVPSGLL